MSNSSKKGDCGETPRVGKPGDSKPTGRRGRRRRKPDLHKSIIE